MPNTLYTEPYTEAEGSSSHPRILHTHHFNPILASTPMSPKFSLPLQNLQLNMKMHL
jgi:hypothetical protein